MFFYDHDQNKKKLCVLRKNSYFFVGIIIYYNYAYKIYFLLF